MRCDDRIARLERAKWLVNEGGAAPNTGAHRGGAAIEGMQDPLESCVGISPTHALDVPYERACSTVPTSRRDHLGDVVVAAESAALCPTGTRARDLQTAFAKSG